MIQITVHGELLTRLDQIPQKLRGAVRARFSSLMDELYKKAVGQLSRGKYETTDEVTYGVETQGSLLIGYMEPLSIKAKVQETGGQGYYEIVPTKAKALVFLARDGKKVFTKFVNHPPVPGKHYILNTITENRPYIEAELDIAARGAPI